MWAGQTDGVVHGISEVDGGSEVFQALLRVMETSVAVVEYSFCHVDYIETYHYQNLSLKW